MKSKLIIGSVFASILAMSILFAYSPSAQAHEGFRGYRGGYYHGGCYGCNWVAPMIIGGVVGYELSRPTPVIVQQQPVYVQQPTYTVTTTQNCTAWVETQHPDGTITRTRTCTQ
jgi:hypothetical protein